jgi:PIN domain nuclease of toxin-antitoxin system
LKYVVDTHALIWFLEGNQRLGANAKTILSDINSKLIFPAIVLAEAAWMVERGRTSIPSVTDLFAAELRLQYHCIRISSDCLVGKSGAAAPAFAGSHFL